MITNRNFVKSLLTMPTFISVELRASLKIDWRFTNILLSLVGKPETESNGSH